MIREGELTWNFPGTMMLVMPANCLLSGAVPMAEPLQEYRLGVDLARRGDMAGAGAAFQRVIDSGDPDVAPAAALDLGLVFKTLGNNQAAQSSYQKAAESGHPDVAPRAARDLGLLLRDMGDA